jgi:hypothetical protein
MPTGKISENFTWVELVKSPVQRANLTRGEILGLRCLVYFILQPLRDQIGVPLYVTSGYRGVYENAAAHGAEHSQHMLGEAVDIASNHHTPEELLAILVHDLGIIPFKIGLYDTHLHVAIPSGDLINHPEPASWEG